MSDCGTPAGDTFYGPGGHYDVRGRKAVRKAIEEEEIIVEEAHVPEKEGQKKQREFVEMMEIAITVDEDTIKRSTNDVDTNSTRNEEWDTAKLNDL